MFKNVFMSKITVLNNVCTYSFERLLNDDKIFSFKTKLIIMTIFRAFQIYNLYATFLLNGEEINHLVYKKNILHRSMNVQNCKYILEYRITSFNDFKIIS